MDKSMKTPIFLVVLLLSLGLMAIGCEWLPLPNDRPDRPDQVLSCLHRGSWEKTQRCVGKVKQRGNDRGGTYFMDTASHKLVKEIREIPKQ